MPSDRIVNQRAAMYLMGVSAKSRSSILLVGPPGHGKTTLANHYLKRFGKYLVFAGESRAATIVNEMTGNNYSVFIDEAHKLDTPEVLYPYIDDSGGFFRRKRVFVFATTDQGGLPGPLVSRLIIVALERYDLKHLAEIAMIHNTRLSAAGAARIARYAHGSPRRSKILSTLIAKSGLGGSVDDILERIGYGGGFNAQERHYIDLLRRNGYMSLASLSGSLGVGTATVKMIEADMIATGLVRITSRGRALIDDPFIA